MTLLAYAEGPDPTDSNLLFVVVALGIIGAVGLMAAIPATMARRRGHRHREQIVTALLLWAILLAGSAIYAVNAQMKYSKEYNRRLLTGYADPKDVSDQPKPPWALLIGLGVAYGGVLVSIGLGKKSSAT
jgi:hypothetical protein